MVVAAMMVVGSPADASASGPGGERPWALLLGDSNMYGSFGHIMRRQLRALGYNVKLKGRPGSGLARPDYWDWEHEGRALVERYDPQVVIIIFGGNDGQRIRRRDGYYKYGIPWKRGAQWTYEYTRRLNGLVDALMTGATASTRAVFVLSPTNRRPPKARQRMQRIRDIQKRVLQARDDVVWVDTFSLSSDAGGQYLKWGRDYRGRHVRLRRRDGIHLTKDGAFHLSYALYPVLARRMHWPIHEPPETDAARSLRAAPNRLESGTRL